MDLLSERKIRILEFIINDYIASAEPVGSRTIARKYGLGLSSATIRNEMSDLEEMGYILAPHASAGRVPSDKGYRLYVDRLMRERELSADEVHFLRQIITGNVNRIDYLLMETAKAISLLTNYTTVISEAVTETAKVKHLQLIPLDDSAVVLVMVTTDKKIKNHTIRINRPPDAAMLSSLSGILNAHLHGKGIEDITSGFVKSLERQFGEYGGLLPPVIAAITGVLSNGRDIQVYTSGIKHILAFPEFSDLDKARAIFETLEEKDLLVMLLGGGRENDIEIVIGQENDISELHDCSIIKASYGTGGQTHGGIGIIGPTRMDYSQVVSVLSGIVKNINQAIKTFEDG